MAGKPVDDTIATLSQYLEEGDVIIDGGNEWYQNTLRRAKELEDKKIHFVGMGISGGEEGARNGPSLMPGGPKEAYDLIEPIITKCAAQVNDGPCTGYVGPVGAGKLIIFGEHCCSMNMIIICTLTKHMICVCVIDSLSTQVTMSKWFTME
jgi:6-phosphogluconate dehydrogenase